MSGKGTCGNCTHFERQRGHRWGHCKAPLPMWTENCLHSYSSSVVKPGDDAIYCDLWAPTTAVAEGGAR